MAECKGFCANELGRNWRAQHPTLPPAFGLGGTGKFPERTLPTLHSPISGLASVRSPYFQSRERKRPGIPRLLHRTFQSIIAVLPLGKYNLGVITRLLGKVLMARTF